MIFTLVQIDNATNTTLKATDSNAITITETCPQKTVRTGGRSKPAKSTDHAGLAHVSSKVCWHRVALVALLLAALVPNLP